MPLRLSSTYTLTFLLIVVSCSCFAQHRRDKQIFRAETNIWLRKNFATFTYERSLGPSSLTLSVGGGWMGLDNQFLPVEKINSIKDRNNIHNSQTVFPKTIPREQEETPYLQRVHTVYTGGMMRFGYNYYFNGHRQSNRLKGLYTGIDLSLIRTFEEQELTYHYIKANKNFSYSGTNRFWTLGISAHVGYQVMVLEDHLTFNVSVQHPFYLPFFEEINTNSPFAGNRWELNLGIGCRIGT